MTTYLTRFSYTPETWARLAKHPEDRRNAARSYIEAVGGKLQGFWYAFGEYDGYTLWEAPDNVAMAAVSVALSGGGALSKCETTVLLTNLYAALGTGVPAVPTPSFKNVRTYADQLSAVLDGIRRGNADIIDLRLVAI